MAAVKLTTEFRHWVRRSRKHCVLCKALRLMVYPAGTVITDPDVAAAARAAGAVQTYPSDDVQ